MPATATMRNSLRVRRLRWAEKLLLLSRTDLTSKISSQPTPISPLSIGFRHNQSYHLLASRKPKLPSTTVRLRIFNTVLPYRHPCKVLKFGSQAPTSNWRSELPNSCVVGVIAIAGSTIYVYSRSFYLL